jgi:hypothetical protein
MAVKQVPTWLNQLNRSRQGAAMQSCDVLGPNIDISDKVDPALAN